jgi:hypothetical protein
VWAGLGSEGAELLASTDGDSIGPAGQGVLFYLYSYDLAALREQLLANRFHVGEIEDGIPWAVTGDAALRPRRVTY